jgi:hydrogenase/urease accessory protein HupE
MKKAAVLLLTILAFALPRPAGAHEVRPAYLEIRQSAPERYDIFWKIPARGDAAIKLDVELPKNCRDTNARATVADTASRAMRWQVACKGGLAGREIRIDGLDSTMLETIVRFEREDGAVQSVRLLAGTTSFVVSEPSSFLGVASVYLPLGVEHILFGFDHLCFVLALLLLIDNVRRLVWAISAFTIAHSFTLTAATLGYVTAPSGPIEALIAFSIAVVASEVIVSRRGEYSPTVQRPWIVAFGFGLLHGFGFAGALSQTGLPQDAIPLALLFFNIGVELGQLAFIGLVLSAGFLVRWIGQGLPRHATVATAYGIGILSAFWTIQRTISVVY